jgi:hypothetical protein
LASDGCHDAANRWIAPWSGAGALAALDAWENEADALLAALDDEGDE